MFKDLPRKILAVLPALLLILFVASLAFQELLPERILGMNKVVWFIFLILASFAARWGGRLLDWIRRIA